MQHADSESGMQGGAFPTRLRPLQEHKAYALLIALMATVYAWASLAARSGAFGFNQLGYMQPAAVAVTYAVGALLIWMAGWVAKSHRLKRIAAQLASPLDSNGGALRKISALLLISLACVIVFWALRTNFFNSDTNDYKRKFARDVPVLGFHVTHDEMLELYVHSRFWHYANLFLAWSVVRSYQVLSVLAGGAFVFLLLVFARLLLPYRWPALFALVVSAGFMQLFFGDAENYTLTSVIILGYLLAGCLAIRGTISVVIPSAVLAVAMCFHLLAGWLLPSLLYLYWLSVRRRQYRAMAVGVALSCLIVGLTLAYFHFHGLPITELFYRSHISGHGLHYGEVLALPSLGYYAEITNLLFLMFPALPFFVPLLWFNRIERTPLNTFLGLASALMLVFMYVWRATLGVYNDWNLFAAGAIPLALLLAYNFLRMDDLPHRTRILVGILLTSAVPSYAWIVSNHFFAYTH